MKEPTETFIDSESVRLMRRRWEKEIEDAKREQRAPNLPETMSESISSSSYQNTLMEEVVIKCSGSDDIWLMRFGGEMVLLGTCMPAHKAAESLKIIANEQELLREAESTTSADPCASCSKCNTCSKDVNRCYVCGCELQMRAYPERLWSYCVGESRTSKVYIIPSDFLLPWCPSCECNRSSEKYEAELRSMVANGKLETLEQYDKHQKGIKTSNRHREDVIATSILVAVIAALLLTVAVNLWSIR